MPKRCICEGPLPNNCPACGTFLISRARSYSQGRKHADEVRFFHAIVPPKVRRRRPCLLRCPLARQPKATGTGAAILPNYTGPLAPDFGDPRSPKFGGGKR